ncbi:MAG TPA: hypothetical protein VGD14_02595, partial [bacterium]
MNNFPEYPITDFSLFLIANMMNLLVTAVFIARARGFERTEYILGLVVVALALPVITIIVLNIMRQRAWWTIVLPLPLIMYCLVELLLDYILKLDFRNTGLVWLYIPIFYVGLWGMIGYSFLIGRQWGFITLATYF